MNLSDICIRRPVFATVVNLLVMLAGLACFLTLPVREYPDVDNPVVSVTTIYIGASPETVDSSVTEPLEQALNGIEGIRSISSISSFGRSSINVEFVAGRDIDVASTDVTNAIQRALGELPDLAERPIVAKAGANSFPIMWLGIQGEGYSPEDLTDIADRIGKPPLQILPGVAEVLIGGQRKYAMRVWLDPQKMAERRVDAADVRRTILESNLQLPAGEIESEARKFTVLADAQINDPTVYSDLIIRDDGDTQVRIKDIGWVELASASYNTITRFSGEPTVGLGIVRQSRSNQLEVSHAVRDTIPLIQSALPKGVTLSVSVDSTIFVEESLKEVWVTLGIAFILVLLVNLIFLRSFATTIISSIAMPVSLVGTLAILYALNFSINVLTLLALVLATGLLVDDAIVVMENVYRRQELGEGRMLAARRGAKEVGFAVIVTTISLAAVFIPLSLLTGSTGRLFREFSLTMAGSILISMFVALSLIPMLCSQFLNVSRTHGRLYLSIERFFVALNHGYERVLSWAVRHRVTIFLFLLANVIFTVWLFRLIPSTLVPIEDRGQFLTVIRAPQGSTLAYTFNTLDAVEKHIQQIPEVQGFFAAIGLGIGGPPNASDGVVFTRLRPWDQRAVKQQQIVGQLFPQFFGFPGALVFPINLPSLGQRSVNDIEFILTSETASLTDFTQVTEAMLARVRQLPDLINVDSDLRLDNPQLNIAFDRERAADLGVPIASIAQSLQMLLGQTKTNEFILRSKQYDVVTALAGAYRSMPEQIDSIYVRARNGSMVPLSGLIRVVPVAAPARLNRYNLQRSATITASLAQGATLGPALAEVQSIAQEELLPGFSTALGGGAREFVESSTAIYLTFAIALVFIYLVLSAQFENFFHPLTILVSVPLAIFGALATILATGNTMNLYSQIGMILLIGLVSKNAILLVEYANQARARGRDLIDAVLEAGKNRFRPILMTSVTSILGAVPLLIATGAGAESRQPIGAAVVGGLTFSTMFTLIVVPVVYLLVVGIAERFGFNMIPPAIALAEEELSHEEEELRAKRGETKSAAL
ncbi:MAG: efflux RND transporter permease subunit [Candidatus Binatia bacterium]